MKTKGGDELVLFGSSDATSMEGIDISTSAIGRPWPTDYPEDIAVVAYKLRVFLEEKGYMLTGNSEREFIEVLMDDANRLGMRDGWSIRRKP